VLSHACGAVFDNPDLIAAAVVGDGEAETGPLATSWHITKFLNPIRDGAVLPVLHLNGYKINNPTLLARIPREELEQLLRGCGWTPYFVEGSEWPRCTSDGGDGRALRAGHPEESGRVPENRDTRAPSMADDRTAYAKGLECTG